MNLQDKMNICPVGNGKNSHHGNKEMPFNDATNTSHDDTSNKGKNHQNNSNNKQFGGMGFNCDEPAIEQVHFYSVFFLTYLTMMVLSFFAKTINAEYGLLCLLVFFAGMMLKGGFDVLYGFFKLDDYYGLQFSKAGYVLYLIVLLVVSFWACMLITLPAFHTLSTITQNYLIFGFVAMMGMMHFEPVYLAVRGIIISMRKHKENKQPERSAP